MSSRPRPSDLLRRLGFVLFLPLAAANYGLLDLQGQEDTLETTKEASGADAPSSDVLLELEAATGKLKGVQDQLDQLKAEFQEPTTKPARRDKIRKEEAPLLARRGEMLLAQTLGSFEKAHKQYPRAEVVKTLMPEMTLYYFQENRFDKVTYYGDLLLEQGHKDVAHITAAAHFANHEFDEARKILEKAKADGGLDPRGEQSLQNIIDAQKLWARETEVRSKEAEADDLPRVLLKTSKGDIRLELFENEAPGTVGNFVQLVESKFYDGVLFHRVIPAFMAQTGDPNTRDEDPKNDGTGGPGYKIPCECYREDGRQHFTGSLSMAHAGKDTGGSQFFMTHLPTNHLNGKHTVFGRVYDEDWSVLRSIQVGDTIMEATVLRKRDHVYEPVKN